jgi:aminoglycoside phosphotransferase (APT) family kinase protein
MSSLCAVQKIWTVEDPAALRRALDPARVRKPLAHLLGLQESDIAVSLDRTHFSATRPTTLQYRVGATREGTDTVVLAELVGEGSEAHAAIETARLSKSRRSQIAKGGAPALLADPALGLVFRPPGLDARLPGLRMLYDVAAATEAAAAAIGASTRGLSVAVTLRAHRLGKRAVLQMDLRGTHTGRIFVRLRPTSSMAGASAYARHQAIAAAMTDAPGISVPKPLHHDSDLGVAFFTALPGHAPRFGQSRGTSEATIVARALASIVARGPNSGRPHIPADELAILGAWIDRVCIVFPNLAGSAGRALVAVKEALAQMTPAELQPCHRDFHEGQLLLNECRAGVLDFDTYCLADPALDIGNLIAHLRMRGVQENRRTKIIEKTFLDAMAPHARPENIATWTRAALLRLGCIYAFTSAGPKLAQVLFREAGR